MISQNAGNSSNIGNWDLVSIIQRLSHVVELKLLSNSTQLLPQKQERNIFINLVKCTATCNFDIHSQSRFKISFSVLSTVKFIIPNRI